MGNQTSKTLRDIEAVEKQDYHAPINPTDTSGTALFLEATHRLNVEDISVLEHNSLPLTAYNITKGCGVLNAEGNVTQPNMKEDRKHVRKCESKEAQTINKGHQFMADDTGTEIVSYQNDESTSAKQATHRVSNVGKDTP